MNRSHLQEPFLREIAECFHATKARILSRIGEDPDKTPMIIEDELKGLYHAIFVSIDGGTSLADRGLVQIIDDEGVAFDRFLHEICFGSWDAARRRSNDDDHS